MATLSERLLERGVGSDPDARAAADIDVMVPRSGPRRARRERARPLPGLRTTQRDQRRATRMAGAAALARPERLRAAAVAIALVIMAVAGGRSVVTARAATEDRSAATTADAIRADEVATRARLDAERAELDRQAATVDADLAAATTDLRTLEAALAEAAARHDALVAEVAVLGPQASAAADAARAVAARVEDLRTCVRATNRAVNLAGAGRHDEARRALAPVRAACDRARAG